VGGTGRVAAGGRPPKLFEYVFLIQKHRTFDAQEKKKPKI
jgi:hypothetical protein